MPGVVYYVALFLWKNWGNNPKTLICYKNLVGTPPLQMVANVMAIQRCNSKSLYYMNSMVNTFMDLEKLTLSQSKCHNIHIGK